MLLCDWAALYSAAEQLAVRQVSSPLPPFEEVGMAMQDYLGTRSQLGCRRTGLVPTFFVLIFLLSNQSYLPVKLHDVFPNLEARPAKKHIMQLCRQVCLIREHKSDF